VLLFGYVGYRGYKVWKREHLLSMARAFIAKSDEQNAVLALRQILASNPRNLEAMRLMAQLAMDLKSPNALQWRKRVVEFYPNSAKDRLALAETALRFNQFAIATNALAGVAEADRNTADYQKAAGAAAFNIGQWDQAEIHLLEASRLAPTDPLPQLNLETLRIYGTNTALIDQARSALQQFAASTTNGNLRCQALRQLIDDAVRFRKTDTALSLSEQLLHETNSVFADNLVRLSLLRAAQPDEFKAFFSKLQQQAASDAAKAYELGTWQAFTARDPAGTLVWLSSLSTNLQSNLRIMGLTADSYSMLKDWPGLQAALNRQNWHESEYMRHALMARALRGQELSAASKTEWEQAAKSANQLATLKMLLGVAAQWKWEDEAEELLWVIVNRNPNETWAVQELVRVLYATGRTRPLMMLFNQQFKSFPSNLDMKNNLAATALLLKAFELKPHEMAREVYQTAPTNASYASTYAFSLYLQTNNSEALKVMEQLTPQQLQKPTIAGYYGLILQASGDAPKAKPYLEAATKATLLPEERKLFVQAKGGA
jgi:hypothetical protein